MKDHPVNIICLRSEANSGVFSKLSREKLAHAAIFESKDVFLKEIRKNNFSLAFIDLDVAIKSNFSILSAISNLLPVVIVHKAGKENIALQAISQGASDFICEDARSREISLMISKFNNLTKKSAGKREEPGLNSKDAFSHIIAVSESMKQIFNTARRIATYNTTVLLTGESGTGKELIAQAIHKASSRFRKPFLAINCGAIPETLIESELFGHKRGSFTDATRDKKGLLEEAEGGTVFLDEIGEMPLLLQVKLLRALQERKIRRVGDEIMIDIDVRIIAATLRDLEEDVVHGRFREDLYYRLNVVSIHIPPLRERRDDIKPLAFHFLKKHAQRLSIQPKDIDDEFMNFLLRYDWYGNVRELENSIERALVLSISNRLEPDSLPEVIRGYDQHQNPITSIITAQNDSLSIKNLSRELETILIERALKRTSGNKTHAAKLLDISHRALLYKIKEYGLEKRREV